MLTAVDRCDRCSARAKFLMRKELMFVAFCTHHAAQHSSALIASGWLIADRASDEPAT